MTQEELKKVLYTIYKNIRCPSCGKKYQFGQIHIKGYFNNLCFLQLECHDHLPLFATIAIPQKSDPKPESSNINSDHILQAYDTLNKFKGKLSDLIK